MRRFLRSVAAAPTTLLRCGGERGFVSLEMAMLMPILLIIGFIAIIQATFYYHSANVAAAAAREAARAEAVYGSSIDNAVTTAQNFITRTDTNHTLKSVAISSTRNATSITVTITARTKTFIPGLDLDITKTAIMPIERFQ